MSWKPEYIILIISSTLIDYFTGIQIYKTKQKLKKKIFLSLSLLTNLGLLFAFKYFNFFSESLRSLLASISIPMNPITLKLLLPVGISFYTFQTLSYTIDVYKGQIKPEKHLGIFAVYVSFFPQLVAGPIERAKNLLPQFYKKQKFEYDRVTDGLKLMIWGFFKKIVIADQLSIIVNTVYNNPANYTGIPLILATIFFAFQIYCDFSGYSDIAIGAAQVMGFNLMDNFKRPYFSKSISEFWKRWHISLSTWFRDYVYISLGGNRTTKLRWYINLFIVFLVSGLWHGANWTFVIWGALHGTYLILGILLAPIRKQITDWLKITNTWIHKAIQMIVTFILVNIGWVFFRANTVQEAFYILKNMFIISLNFNGINLGGIGINGLILAFGSITFMELVHIIQEHVGMRTFLNTKHIIIRWSIYTVIICSILIFGTFNGTEFIYFQF